MQVELTKETIDRIFEKHQDNRVEGMLELFKVTVPNWESIQNMNHFPQVSRKTSDYIYFKIMEGEIEGKTSLGLTWMNYGFGIFNNQGIPDWTVRIEEDKIQYKEK